MELNDLVVEVRDVNLRRLGQIEPEFLDCRLEPRYLAPGDWSVRLPDEHPLHPVLLAPGSGIIVTHTDPAIGVLLSGPSLSPTQAASKDDPQGTTVFTGTTDDVLLWRRTAYPTPSTADVTQQVTAYDVRQGNAESVMRAYVDANLGPSAPVARRVAALTLAANLNRGITVQKSARFDVLGELLASIASIAGLGFRIVQVGAGLQFQVYDPTDKSGLIRLDLANGTLTSQSVERTAPTVTRAIVAGQGVGEDRTLVEVATSTTDESDYGMFGRIERFIDQRNTDDPLELTQSGLEAVLEGASAVAVKALPGDDQTMAYPLDWGLGDTLGLVVGEQTATAQVTSVPILVNASVGVRVGASIGDVQGWDPQAGIRKTVAAQDERLSNLERNLESGTSTIPLPSTNLNDLDRDGLWTIDAASLANTLENWPGQGIPSATTADANNPAGSYKAGQVGTLRVTTTPTRVVQEATLIVNPVTGGLRPLHLSRARSGDGVTWGAWRCTDGVLTVRGQDEQAGVQLHTAPNRLTNVVSMLRSDFTVPYGIQTTDAVQVFRDASGTRQASPQWKALTWNASIPVLNYGSGWAELAVIRTSAGIVKVRGLGTKLTGGPAIGAVLFTLPPGYRPAAMLMFGGPSAGNASNAFLRVMPNGDVLWYGSSVGNTPHLDANCITFPAADVAPNSAWTPVTMDTTAGWTSYHLADSAWPVAAYWQDIHGRVWFRGMVRRAAGEPAGDSQMFTLPSTSFAPVLQIHQGAPAAGPTGLASLHYLGNTSNNTTAFVYKVGNPSGNAAWVSLSHLNLHPVAAIPETSWRGTFMVNGWVKYPSASFPGPSVWSAPDGLQHIRGLIASGPLPGAMTGSMGVNDRGNTYDLMWSTVSNNAFSRINYSRIDHTLTVTSGSAAWLSLDGAMYFLEG